MEHEIQLVLLPALSEHNWIYKGYYRSSFNSVQAL